MEDEERKVSPSSSPASSPLQLSYLWFGNMSSDMDNHFPHGLDGLESDMLSGRCHDHVVLRVVHANSCQSENLASSEVGSTLTC